ncbi:GNAT family N-acetyltransferase [Clostridium sp.]|uniref:GNAT family N-acetyltransferase n=1 Tax=Clostridium sp. TaxID=1506 RepID=UPI0025C52B60|nr:GNAT family N-acetyltransferase [Clostridium sp.]
MSIRVQYNCSNINWNDVIEILKTVGMSYSDSKIQRISFENSHTVIFVFDDDKLVGFGRAISDGIRQAAIYDVAINPEYQGKGLGRLILNSIKEKLPECNFILYAAPGKEPFYEKVGFGKLKTGMGLFADMQKMKDKGFIK